MARLLKPQKVDEVKHRTLPISIDIMLNRNDLTFFFTFGGEEHGASTADEAIALAKEKLKAAGEVEWQPVIQIDFEHDGGHRGYYPSNREKRKPDAHRGGITIGISRFERGHFEGTCSELGSGSAWSLRRPAGYLPVALSQVTPGCRPYAPTTL